MHFTDFASKLNGHAHTDFPEDEEDGWGTPYRDIADSLEFQLALADRHCDDALAGQASDNPGAGWQWQPISSHDFARADCRPTWYCESILVANQPAVLGGPLKTLKTSIAADLGISLAACKSFLGHFVCPKSLRVAILSGESGKAALQSTASRICRSKGLDLDSLPIGWQFDLPQLSRPDHLEPLRRGLERDHIEVVILDPLYMSLLAGGQVKAENLYQTGPLLMAVAQACLLAGSTPIFIHHTKRAAGREGDPIELADLAYSGIAEFARQWILLSRREPFAPGTGQHKLWLNTGGSIGHAGLHAVDVKEGIMSPDFKGRTWNVSVATPTEAKEAARAVAVAAKKEKVGHANQADEFAVLGALDRLDPGHQGIARSELLSTSGLKGRKFDNAITRLLQADLLRGITVKVTSGNGAKKESKGYRRNVPT